jgi:hypothetical protein
MSAPIAYVRTVLGCALLACGGGLALNAVVDPFDVVGTRLLPRYGGLQERYLKVAYLAGHPEFDTFLLGSSRVGTTRTEDVERAFPGARAYNLTVSQANEWDALTLGRWLLATRPALRRLLVQVDWPVGFGPDKPGHALLTAMPPAITGEDPWAFRQRYLLSFPLEPIRLKLAYNLGSIDALDYSLERGYWSRPRRDQRIEADCAGPSGHPFIPRTRAQPARPSALQRRLIDQNVGALRALVEESRARGVAVVIYLAPYHRNALDHIDEGDYLHLLKALAAISLFYNFAFYSPLTSDDCSYYEQVHYRPAAAARLVAALSAGGNSALVRRVDSGNVAEELAFIRRNFALGRDHGRR